MSDRWVYDKLFIDGAWTADDMVGVIEVIDPATEETIGSVPDAGLKATHAAIASPGGPSTTGPGHGHRLEIGQRSYADSPPSLMSVTTSSRGW